MGVLQIFSTREETAELLEAFSVDHGLGVCRYDGGAFSLVASDTAWDSVREGDISRVFLMPANRVPSGSVKPKPREEGWIDVSIGSVVKGGTRQCLTMTTLQAEDRRCLTFKPASWLRGLRRRLAPAFVFGVRGVNVVHGGSSEYPSIGYSAGALAMHRAGTVWKQFSTDNAEFSPLVDRNGG